MKTIAISGASGFVGSSLKKFLEKDGYEVFAITREILNDKQKLHEVISSVKIVINLAGANILSRWTKEYKELLYSSRIDTTSKIVQAINTTQKRPVFLISTSAVGIYDNKQIHDENGAFSNDFLSNLCQKWEETDKRANTHVAIFRFGIVMGKDGGAFAKMVKPFKFGLGGTIGDGEQAFSFVHIDDLLNAYKFIIENKLAETFNLTAPTPTTNKELTVAIGKALNKPTLLPIPEFILQIIFGEGAKVLTQGQSVVPKKLQDLGFEFKYKNIEQTINSLV